MREPAPRAIAYLYEDGQVDVFRVEDRDEAEPGYVTFMEIPIPVQHATVNGERVTTEMPWPDFVDEAKEKVHRKLAVLPNKMVGDRGTCRGCGADVVFVLLPSGKRPPFNYDGESHFATCPDAARFRTTQPRHRPLPR